MRSYKGLFILISIIVSLLLAGCGPHRLKIPEDAYGTGSEALARFHRIVEADRGLGLRFPGFLIGIEKAYRDKIGAPKIEDITSLNIYYHPMEDSIYQEELSGLEEGTPEYKRVISELNRGISRRKNGIERILNDPKRSFISHIAQYSLGTKGTVTSEDPKYYIPYIKEDLFHNAYHKDFEPEDAYEKSNDVLKVLTPEEVLGYRREEKPEANLRISIVDEIVKKESKGEPYTHIFLYCMGWWTDQQESIRNYNSLMGLMMENYKCNNVPFRPLFVGISWHSYWKVIGLGAYPSYFNKANDSDEIGLIWGNKILQNVLIPIKEEYDLPLILIGHSIGIRALTRALMSMPEPVVGTGYYADLVVGLEGAFSIRRFLKGEGLEGYPYEHFEHYARKFVFTWSKRDLGNKGPFWTRLIGGKRGYNYSKKKKYANIFDQFKIVVDCVLEEGEKEYILDDNYNREFVGVKTKNEKQENKKECESYDESRDSVSWKNSFGNQSKISIVDASELIYFNTHYKPGAGHNDIYTPGVAKFIWDCIKNLP